MSALFARLREELLSDLAGFNSPARSPAPDAGSVDDVDRYCGGGTSSGTRLPNASDALDESGRLWLAQEERNDAATMAALAGEELQPRVRDLRRADGETFVRVDANGRSGAAVEFIETDANGRARYLHDGRAAPRVS